MTGKVLVSLVALLYSVLLVQGTIATSRGYESRFTPIGRSLLARDCIHTEQRCVTAQQGSTATVAFETSCGPMDIENVDIVASWPSVRCSWRNWVSSQGAGRVALSTDCLSPGFYLLRIEFSGGGSLLTDLYVYDTAGRITPSTACLYAQSYALGAWPGHICSCV